MTVHRLKSRPEFFDAIRSGDRSFDIRSTADRNFRVGDILDLQEHNGDGYTGEHACCSSRVLHSYAHAYGRLRGAIRTRTRLRHPEFGAMIPTMAERARLTRDPSSLGQRARAAGHPPDRIRHRMKFKCLTFEEAVARPLASCAVRGPGTIRQVALEHGIAPSTLQQRIGSGMSMAGALAKPIRGKSDGHQKMGRQEGLHAR